MDLDRPASRSGAHDRPVTRWRREERPPSRNGVAEDSSRFAAGDDRPVSRRGLKPETTFQVSCLNTSGSYYNNNKCGICCIQIF